MSRITIPLRIATHRWGFSNLSGMPGGVPVTRGTIRRYKTLLRVSQSYLVHKIVGIRTRNVGSDVITP